MKKVKKWIIKYWLTIVMYIMFYTTFYIYKQGYDTTLLAVFYILTMAVTRTEGGYIESFKTDFFYKAFINAIDRENNANKKEN